MPAPAKLDIYQTSLPMKSFSHAAAKRHRAEAIVVRLEYDDGLVGWGETLPRDYVTGETLDTVIDDIRDRIWPKCIEGGLLEPSDTPAVIPAQQGRRCMNAAAAAVDLASLRRMFHDIHTIPPERLQAIAGRARMRTYIDTPVTGVLGSEDTIGLSRKLRLMRWFGLRDFKLKLGLGDRIDRENLGTCYHQLRRGLAKGHYTLRVDVNGGWSKDETPDRVAALRQFGVCCVEQPVYCSARELLALAKKCALPLMADESLLKESHAKTLAAEPEKVWWNLRISKNGGLLATLQLMRLAQSASVPFTLGCMVGESSILSAAQRRLLQLGPVPKFVEGSYGRFLLEEDLLAGRKSLRFGYGGTLKPLSSDGLGVEPSDEKIRRFSQHVETLEA
jgi:L-Ala-D/L-Glu epimerase